MPALQLILMSWILYIRLSQTTSLLPSWQSMERILSTKNLGRLKMVHSVNTIPMTLLANVVPITWMGLWGGGLGWISVCLVRLLEWCVLD